MRFENAKCEIEYLKGLDVVLMNSIGNANLDNDIDTRYHDDDFGL